MNIGPAIGIAIGTALGGLICALLGRKAKKAAEQLSDEVKARMGKRFTVRQPRERLGASIFLMLLFCGGPISLLVFCFDELIEFLTAAETVGDIVLPVLFMLAVFLPLMLLSLWCLLRALVWSVQVDGERVVFTSFLGKKTAFAFKDVSAVKTYTAKTGQAIKVFVKGKKLFAADPGCVNFFILSERLEKRAQG